MAPLEVAAAPLAVPASLADAVAGYSWARDRVGESGGLVHRLHASARPALFLKSGTGDVVDALCDELVRLRWLGAYMTVPEVRGFVLADDAAWLLMTAIPGRTAYQVLADAGEPRAQTVTALARHMRALHALPLDACPFDSGHAVRMAHARRRIDAGLVDEDDFGDAHEGWSAQAVWDRMMRYVPHAPDTVVTHGDYSLDNILIEGGEVTGCIDIGRLGKADRYQDIAILCDCLDEFDGDLQARFLDEYGIADPDRRKIDFYLCLDEMF